MRKYWLIALILISAPLIAGRPRTPFPKTSDEIWQNDQDIQAGQMQYPDTRTFVGTFTRDLTVAASSVAYTGVGFRPTSITYYAVVASSQMASWGFSGQNASDVISSAYLTKPIYDTWTGQCIALTDATEANYQTATLTSYDADGFTLTWVKNGSPTGLARIFYKANR